jgi:hypothetical protein
VFVDGYPLKQVLAKERLGRGTFFADLNEGRLYVWDSGNRDISSEKIMVEACISISSSPYCIIERNLFIGNKEGLSLREQKRTTAKIEGGPEPVLNHHQMISNNVFAYNRDAQVWGWFHIDDERYWPKSMQQDNARRQDRNVGSSANGPLSGSSLADLELTFRDNIYCPGPGQGLFNWRVTWKRHKRHSDLDTVCRELSLERGSRIVDTGITDFHKLDFRVLKDSPVMRMRCYPKGDVGGVRLGTYTR